MNDVTYSRDGKSIITSANDQIDVWETGSGKLLRHFAGFSVRRKDVHRGQLSLRYLARSEPCGCRRCRWPNSNLPARQRKELDRMGNTGPRNSSGDARLLGVSSILRMVEPC